MARKTVFFLILATALLGTSQAQQERDPVMFEINGKKILRSEFMHEFLRSVGKDPSAPPTACTYEKRKALNDYVELFANYRTKLEDAHAIHMDTTPSLKRELDGYRNDLAAPYLIDSMTMENILHEAYERNHYTLHAAHILVPVKRIATPADTQTALQEAYKYYNRAMAGEDFYALAKEANEIRFKKEMLDANDPRRNDNGDVGNFTVFNMIYPFENAAYSLKPGEISKPIRTMYGYHIVKLLHKSPYFGKASISHIWCAFDDRPEYTEVRIREAYNKLLNGEPFKQVCLDYSDDKSTNLNGGTIGEIAPSQMPPEYVEHLSTMLPGQYSAPFKTEYGWHIIMLNKRDSLPSYQDMVPYYKQRMVRDDRSNGPRDKFIEQSKKRYDFVDYTRTEQPSTGKKTKKGKQAPPQYMASLDECRKALNDSIFTKRWRYREEMVTDMRPLFKIGDKQYTAVDLLKYLEETQRAVYNYDLDVYLNQHYDEFIQKKVYEYADQHLEQDNAEFAKLMEEYRNGLLIFAYNEAMVWGKAIKDTAGLRQFYNESSQNHNIDNEDDARYFWDERADVVVATIADSNTIAPDKVYKIMSKAQKKKWDVATIRQKIESQIKTGDKTGIVNEQLVEKNHQQLLKESQWSKGVHSHSQGKGYRVMYVRNLLDPKLKTLEEARGHYVSDYQNYLDRQLILKLRKQYNVIIHQDVVDETTY